MAILKDLIVQGVTRLIGDTTAAKFSATSIYENGTALSSKYLGISAKAADADKLDGNDSTYFAVKKASVGSATNPIYTDANGVFQACTYSLNKTVPSGALFTDTDVRNTAGGDDTSSKIFLVGMTAQTTSNGNSRTYTQDTAYVGTDGHLYSNAKQVVNLTDTQAITNKTYNGLTLTAQTTGFYIGGGNTTAKTLIVNDNYTLQSACGHAHEDYVTAIGTSGNTLTWSKGGTAQTAITVPYATAAGKLNTNAGSATNPVYFTNGVPVACTYSLNKTVPADAVFTDTTYSANNGVGLSGTTFYNSGVRAATINGNYLRINTNGTNADLTIPYATNANYAATAGSAPASDVYAWAKEATKPSYNFGDIGAGNATIGDGANRINLRTQSNWASAIYHNTDLDEAVVFLAQAKNNNSIANYTTSWIFAYENPTNRPSWTGLTPALQIKGESVIINKLIGSKQGSAYNLDVNGTIGLSGQLTSTVSDGTAPLVVASTTAVANLNADLLDGQHGSYYQPKVSALGSATEPVYISAAGTFSKASKYAGGTAVTLNGTSAATITASFYAPTGAGTSGQILKSSGSGAPTWANQSTITAGALTTVSKTAWGRTYWTSGGVPDSISGDMFNVGNIAFQASGKNIGGTMYFDTTNHRIGINDSTPSCAFDVTGDVQASGGIAAGGILNLAYNGAGTQGTLTQIQVNGRALTDTSGIVNIPLANTSSTGDGAMSHSDKLKLDGIATGATNVNTDTVAGWGYTKNAGTVTGVKMNGSVKGSSGVVDLGTVITDVSGKADKQMNVLVDNNGSATITMTNSTTARYHFVRYPSSSSVTAITLQQATSALTAANCGTAHYELFRNEKSTAITLTLTKYSNSSYYLIAPSKTITIPANSSVELSYIHIAGASSTFYTVVTIGDVMINVS